MSAKTPAARKKALSALDKAKTKAMRMVEEATK